MFVFLFMIFQILQCQRISCKAGKLGFLSIELFYAENSVQNDKIMNTKLLGHLEYHSLQTSSQIFLVFTSCYDTAAWNIDRCLAQNRLACFEVCFSDKAKAVLTQLHLQCIQFIWLMSGEGRIALNVIFKIELVFKQFACYIHDVRYFYLIHAQYNLKKEIQFHVCYFLDM